MPSGFLNAAGLSPRTIVRGLFLLGLLVFAGTSASAQDFPAIPKYDTWKWFAGPTAPDTHWMSPSFSDAAWSEGPGILGYGETYIATVLPWGPSEGNKWRTTYFRRTFALSGDPADWNAMLASVNFDDGFVMYLNGMEILRMYMPDSAVAWSTYAVSHEGGMYETYDLSAYVSNLVAGDNVIAVEVHQSSNESPDLVWDAQLSLLATLSRGPYLQMGAPDAMSVRWRTTTPTTTRAWLGTAGSLIPEPADLTPTTEHEFRFTGLSPATSYAYGIGTADSMLAGGTSDYVFKTHPVAGTHPPIRIWAIGDAGEATPEQKETRDAYFDWTGERGTDVCLLLGDNAYPGGSDPDYQIGLFDPFQALFRTVPTWPTRGNHDRTFAAPELDFYDIFTLPTAAEAGGLPSGTERYYSFDFGNVHFVCLDSEGNNRLPGSPMYAWLRDDLSATERTWVIAYWHHPPYSKGNHDSDDDLDSDGKMGNMRRFILPILDSLGVDLVLTGHSHSYERSFLLDGYYDTSVPFAPENVIDGGAGRAGAGGVYYKPTVGTGPHEGTVYVVAGSTCKARGGSLDHSVMVESLNEIGSLILDVDGNRLDARFLSHTGAFLDSFTIVKGSLVAADSPPAPARLWLSVAGSNPSRGETRFRIGLREALTASLDVMDIAGRSLVTVVQKPFAAGEHVVRWNGRDRLGRPAPPGIYFAVLEAGSERRAVRFVLAR